MISWFLYITIQLSNGNFYEEYIHYDNKEICEINKKIRNKELKEQHITYGIGCIKGEIK